MIKALIWDIGGVIFLAKDKTKRNNRKNIHTSIQELWVLLDGIDTKNKDMLNSFKKIYFKSSRGNISKEETLIRLSKLLNLKKEDIKKLIIKTLEKHTVENKFVLNIIKKLISKRYKQGILSTQWTLSNEFLISKKYNALFDNRVISCVDKLTKPDVKAFNLILKRLGVLPEQTIFIDDNKENIKVAKNLGINSILFKDNKKLKKDLKKLI
jgi:epoxide hydrolase-like predicted phosphatase